MLPCTVPENHRYVFHLSAENVMNPTIYILPALSMAALILPSKLVMHCLEFYASKDDDCEGIQ